MGIRRRRRGHRSWPQRFLILVNSLLVVACIAAAGLFNLIRQKAAELPVVDIGAEVRQQVEPDGPRNILLVGTDSSSGLDDDDPVTNGRDEGEHLADVIMILRIDPKTKDAALLSIPRDSWLPVAPTWSKTKINSAYGSNDGSNLLIATIKHNFGISIDNFVEVDFAGFKGLVEVLGGIPTFNEHPIRDPSTGLFLPVTGCIVIDPPQALAYARSRHLEYQEGTTYDKKAKWKTDPTSDLGRITRQQDFLRQAAQRAIDEGIRNPSTAVGLVNAALESVTVDRDLDGDQILDLISTFREFSVEDLASEQIPTVGVNRPGISYQEIQWAEAEGLLDVFRGIRAPGEVVPGDVIVGLPAATASSVAMAEQLDALGFDAGTEDSSVEAGASKKGADRPTVIRFGLRGQEAARVLASHLGGPVTFEWSSTLPGRRLELVPGTDVPAVLESPTPIDQIPEPTIPPSRPGRTTTTTSTTVPRGSTTVPGSATTTSVVSAPPTSTLQEDVPTTTAPGFLPLNAAAAAECN